MFRSAVLSGGKTGHQRGQLQSGYREWPLCGHSAAWASRERPRLRDYGWARTRSDGAPPFTLRALRKGRLSVFRRILLGGQSRLDLLTSSVCFLAVPRADYRCRAERSRPRPGRRLVQKQEQFHWRMTEKPIAKHLWEMNIVPPSKRGCCGIVQCVKKKFRCLPETVGRLFSPCESVGVYGNAATDRPTPCWGSQGENRFGGMWAGPTFDEDVAGRSARTLNEGWFAFRWRPRHIPCGRRILRRVMLSPPIFPMTGLVSFFPAPSCIHGHPMSVFLAPKNGHATYLSDVRLGAKAGTKHLARQRSIRTFWGPKRGTSTCGE